MNNKDLIKYLKTKSNIKKMNTNKGDKVIITAQEMYAKFFKNEFKHYDCHLSKEQNRIMKQFIRGGYIALNPKYKNKIIKANIFGYDIHSAYFAKIKYEDMPYGRMEEIKIKKGGQWIENDTYKFMHLQGTWKRKKDKLVCNCPTFMFYYDKNHNLIYSDNETTPRDIFLLEEELNFLSLFYEFELKIMHLYSFKKKKYLSHVVNKIEKELSEIKKDYKKDYKRAMSSLIGYTALGQSHFHIYSPIFIVITALQRITIQSKIWQCINNGYEWIQSATDSIYFFTRNKRETRNFLFSPSEIGEECGQWESVWDETKQAKKYYIRWNGTHKTEDANGNELNHTEGHLNQLMYWEFKKKKRYEPSDEQLEEMIKKFVNTPIENWKKILGKEQINFITLTKQDYKEIDGK